MIVHFKVAAFKIVARAAITATSASSPSMSAITDRYAESTHANANTQRAEAVPEGRPLTHGSLQPHLRLPLLAICTATGRGAGYG